MFAVHTKFYEEETMRLRLAGKLQNNTQENGKP